MSPRPLRSFRVLAASNPWPSSPTVSSTLLAVADDLDLNPAGSRVFDNVVESLLSDPVQGERGLRVEGIDLAFSGAGNRDWMCSRDSSTVGGQGGRQSTGTVSTLGCRSSERLSDALADSDRALLDRGDGRLQIVVVNCRSRPPLETAERDRQRGKLLAHVVVQVTCHSRPLGILRRDERPSDIENLLITGLQLWPRCRESLPRLASAS